MKVICCYCKKDLGDKAPFEDNRVSHGACDECANQQMAIIADLKTRMALKDNSAVNPAH
ncbi:MAG: hypothetical protein ABIN18_05560 [Pseudomonadota bacterium]